MNLAGCACLTSWCSNAYACVWQEPVKEKEVVEAVASKPKATVPNGTERQAATEEDAVKGLPSLGPRPKKKAAQPPAESATQAEA